MTDIGKSERRGRGQTGEAAQPRDRDSGEKNRGSRFGTREPATAGTDRDSDERGESMNQGHGHPREERNRRGV